MVSEIFSFHDAYNNYIYSFAWAYYFAVLAFHQNYVKCLFLFKDHSTRHYFYILSSLLLHNEHIWKYLEVLAPSPLEELGLWERVVLF